MKIKLNKVLGIVGKVAILAGVLGAVFYTGISLADNVTPASVAAAWNSSMKSYAQVFQGACTVVGFTLLGACAFLFNEHGKVKHQHQSRLHQAILTGTVGGGLLAISVLGPFAVIAAGAGSHVGQVNGSDIVTVIGS